METVAAQLSGALHQAPPQHPLVGLDQTLSARCPAGQGLGALPEEPHVGRVVPGLQAQARRRVGSRHEGKAVVVDHQRHAVEGAEEDGVAVPAGARADGRRRRSRRATFVILEESSIGEARHFERATVRYRTRWLVVAGPAISLS